ncbi:NAD(P)H-dependent oxidoreductase [Anaerococcus sp. Marseille-Q7828]|uniref:NADPH-dependent FMN reductase n=1 Tax=Anaerococcus sp. Marseille-Q7828 TaxID=3036300 RepID=UPI0024AE73FF|nr:NAD(P)H-dependent oxidoreductase [Anaerococcus sp. Marseille-Q7828]
MPEGFEASFIEIGDLPLFNEEYDDGTLEIPESYTRFRNELANTDAFIFVTPEYNRAMPASIKNAIDDGLRPYEDMKWAGKKVVVISSSVSMTAGVRANYEVRTSLAFLGATVLAQPEVMLSEINKCFDENGNMIEFTKEFLASFVEKFVEFVK